MRRSQGKAGTRVETVGSPCGRPAEIVLAAQSSASPSWRPMNRRRLLKIFGLPAAAAFGAAGLVTAARSRNRYYEGPRDGPFRRRALLLPGPAPGQGPGRAAALAARRRTEGLAGAFREPVPRHAPGVGAGAAGRPRRPCDPADPGRGAQHPHRSGLRRAREPRLLRRAEAGEPAGHRLRGSAADPRGADHPQPLRPSRRRHPRPPLAARPPAHPRAPRQRHHHPGRGSGDRGRDPRLGPVRRTRRQASPPISNRPITGRRGA